MNKINGVLIAILIISSYGNSFAQSGVNSDYQKSDLSSKILNQNSSEIFVNKINSTDKKQTGKKSPYLGALFSGIIPGTGEIYSEHYLKAGIFLAIEAGLWIAYGSYESKGNEQTDQFQTYANQNWSINKYAQWIVDEQFTGYAAITNPQNPDHNQLRREINIVEAQNFSHQLPPIGDQQYYELIGKYHNFVSGWADANTVTSQNYVDYTSPMFVDYSYQRQEANNYYDKASTMTSLVIVNHILSAADAAWSVTMFNKNLKVKSSVHLENKYSYYGEKKLIPVASLNVTF